MLETFPSAIGLCADYVLNRSFLHRLACERFEYKHCFFKWLSATIDGAGAATDYGDIPDDIAAPGIGYLESMETVLGKITAKGNAGVDGHTYELEPEEVNGILQWTASGTCYTENYCR